MLDNLKIALKRQKKLIIIFLITIFLPSIALSIFGVRSIKNERFRLVKQIEEEHKIAADFLKNQISFRFEDIGIILRNLAQHPSFKQKDYISICELLNNQLKDSPLIEHVFLAYEDEESLFPLFLPFSDKRASTTLSPLKSAQRERLERAQRLEFSQKNLSEAIVLYKQIFSRSQNMNIQAQMLNNIGRCYIKLENYDKAVQNYTRICEEYPRCTTSYLLPLSLIANIQIVRCYREVKAHEKFLKNSLNLYKSLLDRQWYLDADQFKTYSSWIKRDISEFLSAGLEGFKGKDYNQEFEELKKLHQEIDEQWQVVKDVREFILPELRRTFIEQGTSPPNPLGHAQTISHKEYLILAVAIPHEEETHLDLLGIKLKKDYLLNHLIKSILEDLPFSREMSFSVSTISGQILLGHRNLPAKRPTVSEYFENNFPPWRIEFFLGGADETGIIDIRKSFYFWTILTIMVLLTFGTVLVVRTIAHEMEVLRIKSDFVSSVSHEFNTPITAIKALSERLLQGKVKTLLKKKDYYGIILKDADKLSSLVKNILDFSKVEEGRREYVFRETDISQLVRIEIENFKRDKIYAGIKIDTQIYKKIPHLYVDRNAFSLALNNLLENAVKFSKEKKDISVKVRKEGENVRVDIKDSGMGIDSHEMDKIFDKFYQGNNATKLSVKGTGLGLALVKHVMEAQGGRVVVKSKPGQGSTFSLIFPHQEKGSKM